MNHSASETQDRGLLVFFAPAPSGGAGAERRALLIAEALVSRGWRVLVVGRSGGGRRFVVRRHGELRIVEIPGFGRRKLGAACFLVCGAVVGLMRSPRAHGYLALQLSSPATAAAVCGIMTRRPFVVLGSTSGMLSESSLMKNGPGSGLRRGLLKRAAALVGQTETAAAELSECFPDTTVTSLPNPAPRLQASQLTGKPTAAYAGRLSEEKDLPSLLRAWEMLAQRRPGAILTLIGSGGEFRSVEDDLRSTVEQSPVLRSSVRFTGWLPTTAGTVAESDLFVFPSLSEGMSNALLEACVLGRIVVASDIPPNVAVLGDAYPLLYPAGDALALERALERAFDDDTARSRSLAQIAGRLPLFSPDHIVTQLERLLLGEDRARN